MQYTRTVCDRCGVSVEEKGYFRPEGFISASLEISSSYEKARQFDFCPNCSKGLGLFRENGSAAPVTDVKDRLFEVITEIVQECTE